MKIIRKTALIRNASLLLLATLSAQLVTTFAQDTAFTYQGRLDSGAAPASGSYDLRFTLYDDSSAGSPAGGPLTNAATAVSNGLFTVTLDFGAGVLTGPPRWIEIGVRTNGAGGFTALAPRQRLTPVPYAIHAAEAMFVKNGIVSNPTFVGTTTSAAIELYANNQRGLRLESSSGGVPNLVAGGAANTVATSVVGSTIAGGGVPGFPNSIDVSSSFIGAGNANSITGPPGFNNAFIGAGYGNFIASTAAFIGSGNQNSILTNADFSLIGGGMQNTNAGFAAVIGGGRGHVIGTNSQDSMIAGGYYNTIAPGSQASVISGGGQNFVAATIASISGGGLNSVTAFGGVIGGGESNTNNALIATIGGGRDNRILSGAFAATIPGGQSNIAGGEFSFAAGRRAFATNNGAFVWADSIFIPLGSTNANSVTMRASGGYRLFSNTNATAGVFLAPDDTSWSSISDRNAKRNFAPVDGEAVLRRLAAVPIQQWNYQWEPNDTVPHIGPMAQDFKAAFYPGRDDTTISTMELDGVALAAIQGLNEKLEGRSQKAEISIQELRAENAELKQRLEKLEQLLTRNQN